MARAKRRWISQERGSFHIISRIAGGELLLKREEKDYFLELLKRFASGFFVRIHAFCIMDNHFHILATGMEMSRVWSIYLSAIGLARPSMMVTLGSLSSS